MDPFTRIQLSKQFPLLGKIINRENINFFNEFIDNDAYLIDEKLNSLQKLVAFIFSTKKILGEMDNYELSILAQIRETYIRLLQKKGFAFFQQKIDDRERILTLSLGKKIAEESMQDPVEILKSIFPMSEIIRFYRDTPVILGDFKLNNPVTDFYENNETEFNEASLDNLLEKLKEDFHDKENNDFLYDEVRIIETLLDAASSITYPSRYLDEDTPNETISAIYIIKKECFKQIAKLYAQNKTEIADKLFEEVVT